LIQEYFDIKEKKRAKMKDLFRYLFIDKVEKNKQTLSE